MPRPRKGEKESAYIKRAIKYMTENEGLTPKQAVGKAYGLWKQEQEKKDKG